ncbi:hypothetical protein [Microbacterium karelineae]|uniref:hypothetical protein n=1 Tax=Microbacterium karelineae TaxID=2654283 RepID=UPI0012EAAC66|nr:hypothetical protein [Microbacterium karelineae]
MTDAAQRRPLSRSALVLAIVGIGTSLVPFLTVFAVIPLTAALVFAIVALAKRADGRGTSIAALIVALVGYAMTVVMFLVSVGIFVWLVTPEPATPGALAASPGVGA